MKKLTQCITTIACAIALLGASGGAYANQRSRIKQGEKSGELTEREKNRLMLEQRGIRKMRRNARSDGKMTVGERRRQFNAERKASANIYKQKHDAQVAPAAEQEPNVEK